MLLADIGDREGRVRHRAEVRSSELGRCKRLKKTRRGETVRWEDPQEAEGMAVASGW